MDVYVYVEDSEMGSVSETRGNRVRQADD